MSFLKTSQLFVLGISVLAAPVVFANGAQSVKLSCPSGTVQKGGRLSKTDGVYCVKSKQQTGESVAHGPYVDFHANGQKQSEGQLMDGFRSGRWTYWDANGVKTGETDFEAGDYHGTRIEYHANGSKKLEQQWVRGKREGVEIAYAEDGQKTAEIHFNEGRAVKQQRFENGKPVASK